MDFIEEGEGVENAKRNLRYIFTQPPLRDPSQTPAVSLSYGAGVRTCAVTRACISL